MLSVSLSAGASKSGALLNCKAPEVALIENCAASAPPTIEYCEVSLAATVCTAVVFSTMLTDAALVKLGAVRSIVTLVLIASGGVAPTA